MKLFLASFCLLVSLSAHAANFPFIRLNGHTNQVSDNGTALTRDGVPLGGSSLWTDFTAFIAPSNFTNEARIFPSAGNLLTTFQLGNEFGTNMGSYNFVVGFNDSNGDPDTSHGGGIILEFTHNTNEIALFDVAMRPGQFVDTEGKVVSGANSTYWELYQDSADIYLHMRKVGGSDYLNMNPTVADGASAVAYKEWTFTALSNAGAKIHSFGTTSEKAAVFADGSLTTGGGTDKWIFKSVTEGVTTNIVVNINGKDYTIPAF